MGRTGTEGIVPSALSTDFNIEPLPQTSHKTDQTKAKSPQHDAWIGSRLGFCTGLGKDHFGQVGQVNNPAGLQNRLCHTTSTPIHSIASSSRN